jgi:hypothetical protein
MLYSGSGLGWEFEAPLDSSQKPGDWGLVLQNVRHAGHNFAKDIRNVGLWISIDHVDKYKNVVGNKNFFRTLSASNYLQPSSARILNPKRSSRPDTQGAFDYLKQGDAGLRFSEYFQGSGGNYVAFGITVAYDAPTLFKQMSIDNCEYAGISIEQTFLFSHYSDTPPHEPSGNLSAARCHPLIRYKLIENKDFKIREDGARISAIRFDYRLHLYVDPHYANVEVPRLDANQAALFADTDIGVARALGRLATEYFSSRPLIPRESFYAVEKPLVLEVTAPGLVKGVADGRKVVAKNPPPEEQVVCWDNVHWWGARAPGLPMISSPGAFHAAHIHWRWGEVTHAAKYAPGFSWRRFFPGQPLLDPDIATQTIRVAVTENRKELDPERNRPQKLSTMAWKDLFHNYNNSPPPKLIQNGGDIVLWYSSEVFSQVTVEGERVQGVPLPVRTVTAAPGGTVFLHGIFFAHDDEKEGPAVGSRDPLYWNGGTNTDASEIAQKKEWFRPAND